jgi:subtilisin family serine protease
VRVRVLDTGLVKDAQLRHTWLVGVTVGRDAAGGAPNAVIPQDGGHGTFTAGCVRVTAPEADVHVVNAAAQLPRNNQAGDLGAAFESRLAEVLRRQLVADPGGRPLRVPDVVVLNFAGTTRDGRPPVALAALYDSVIQHLAEPLILSPAGKDQRKNWPASFDWVVSVGALAGDGSRAPWSNHGRSVDVFAPGDRLVNAYATGKYTTNWDPANTETRLFDGLALWSGTSFSTPLVAGLVAARMSSTGQSSKRAWASLLELAERQVVPGAGPALYPGQELD